MFLSLSVFVPDFVYLCDLQHLIKKAFWNVLFFSMVVTQWCVQREKSRDCLRLVRKKLPDICTPQWQHWNACYNKNPHAALSLQKSDSQFPVNIWAQCTGACMDSMTFSATTVWRYPLCSMSWEPSSKAGINVTVIFPNNNIFCPTPSHELIRAEDNNFFNECTHITTVTNTTTTTNKTGTYCRYVGPILHTGSKAWKTDVE